MKFISIFALLFFSTAAFAEVPTPQGAGMGQLLILGVFVFFLFWMMRSQSKRAKEHQNLINKLEIGDEIVVNGGLVGKITKIKDAFFLVQFSEGFDCLVQKNMIATTLPKGTIKSVKS